MTEIINGFAVLETDGLVVACFVDETDARDSLFELSLELDCETAELLIAPCELVEIEGGRLVTAHSEAGQKELKDG